MTTTAGKDEFSLGPDEQRLVLDAAMEYLSQSGLQANMVEKVAERSGISATKIYVHFGGTDKMLETLLDRELALIAGSVTLPELRFPGETLRDELEGLAHIILDQCRAHVGFLRTIMTEALRNEEFSVIFYRTFILRGRTLFSEFLAARTESGELRHEIDIEAAAAFFLSSLVFSLLLMEVFGGKEVESLDDDRLVKSMSELFLKGVSQTE